MLRDEFGSTLEVKGAPYPGEQKQAVVPELIKLLEQLQGYTGPCKIVP